MSFYIILKRLFFVSFCKQCLFVLIGKGPVSYTHLRAHETGRNLVCRLLLEKKKKQENKKNQSQYNYNTKKTE